MSRFVVAFVTLWWSALACAQGTPNVGQWIAVFEAVRQHAMFNDLHVTYAKAPPENMGYTPVGVLQRDGVDCVVVVSEGQNPTMDRLMELPTTPAIAQAFMQTIAAHEFGHCLRMRGRHLSVGMWARVAVTAAGSAERAALEKLLSIEEAYADAYAFVYLQATHPQWYADVLRAMQALRHMPAFATPYYQVEPLYAQLAGAGLDLQLPLPDQVEALMAQAKFY